MNAGASSELAYPVDRSLASLAHDVDRSKLFSQQDPILMASHDNDLFGPETLRCDESAQATCAVTNYGDLAAVRDPCSDRRTVPCP
jgi:hypothetical protein